MVRLFVSLVVIVTIEFAILYLLAYLFVPDTTIWVKQY